MLNLNTSAHDPGLTVTIAYLANSAQTSTEFNVHNTAVEVRSWHYPESADWRP
jgi:hypothetical protein